MWNPIKITKSIKQIMTEYGSNRIENADRFGEHRVGSIPSLYREMRFPFGLFLLLKSRKSKLAKSMINGKNQNDKQYVENDVLPILQNSQYLKSLSKKTVGSNYYNIVKNFSLDDLYNQRFKSSEIKEGKSIERLRDKYQSNISRHVLTTHDIWHTLFDYDTNPLGEGMIQLVTGHLLGYAPPKIVGFLITLKVYLETRDIGVWKVYKECKQNIKKCNHEVGYFGATKFLEKDIKDIRLKYNIAKPHLYLEFIKKHKQASMGSTIHNYKTINELWNGLGHYLES